MSPFEGGGAVEVRDDVELVAGTTIIGVVVVGAFVLLAVVPEVEGPEPALAPDLAEDASFSAFSPSELLKSCLLMFEALAGVDPDERFLPGVRGFVRVRTSRSSGSSSNVWCP